MKRADTERTKGHMMSHEEVGRMKKTPSHDLGTTELITLSALLREVLAEERAGLTYALRSTSSPAGDQSLWAPEAAEHVPPTRLPETPLRFKHPVSRKREAVA